MRVLVLLPWVAKQARRRNTTSVVFGHNKKPYPCKALASVVPTRPSDTQDKVARVVLFYEHADGKARRAGKKRRGTIVPSPLKPKATRAKQTFGCTLTQHKQHCFCWPTNAFKAENCVLIPLVRSKHED